MFIDPYSACTVFSFFFNIATKKMTLPSWSQLQNYKNTSYDTSYNAFVGWENTIAGDCMVNTLFSEQNIMSLQNAIKDALHGVDPTGKSIIVTPEQITGVLSTTYRNSTRPNIGDIHSRFIVPQNEPRCDLRSINNQTMNIIIRTIRDEIETAENNKKLSIWSTVYGDFNKEGLRAHPPIKIRRKHPQYMAFNMKY